MATNTALKFISDKHKLLAIGISRNINIGYIPIAIQSLFITYYIEYDSFIPNTAYQVSNLNTEAMHLFTMKYSYIYGNVIMNGSQIENIIYQWNLKINYCQNASLQFGIMNCKYEDTANEEDEIHYSYRAVFPVSVHYKGWHPKNKWISLKKHRNLPYVRNGDIMTISVKFKQGESTIISFSKNMKEIMTYHGVDSQYNYKLFVCMGKTSQYDKISIVNFQTICYK